MDYYWEKLSQGGDPKAQQCGWLKDKYGVSWQVVPAVVKDLLGDPTSEKSERAMEAMLEMKKIDVAALERAHDGEVCSLARRAVEMRRNQGPPAATRRESGGTWR